MQRRALRGRGDGLQADRSADRAGLIRDAADDKVKLIRSDEPNVSISDRFVVNGKVFIPPTVNDDVMRAINLPSNAADYGSTAALFDDLQRLFRSHPGLSPS